MVYLHFRNTYLEVRRNDELLPRSATHYPPVQLHNKNKGWHI